MFPVDLSNLKDTSSTTLGVVTTSPLKIEIEFNAEPPATTWYLGATFIYLNKIKFTGQKSPQEPQLIPM